MSTSVACGSSMRCGGLPNLLTEETFHAICIYATAIIFQATLIEHMAHITNQIPL